MSRFGGRILAAALCTLAALLPVRAPVAAAEPWQPCGDGLPSFAPVLALGATP